MHQMEWSINGSPVKLHAHGLVFEWNGSRTLTVYLDGQAIDAREVHHYDTMTEAPLTTEQAVQELREFAEEYGQE